MADRYELRRAGALWLVVDTRRDEAVGEAVSDELVARLRLEQLERQWRREVAELCTSSWRSW